MSNSVDEAVFDYFALLLSESTSAEQEVAASAASVPVDEESKRIDASLKSQPQMTARVRAPLPSMATKNAEHQLNKKALEQLLAPVAEAGRVTAEPKISLETLDVVASVASVTQVVDKKGVTPTAKPRIADTQINEKIATSTSIKLDSENIDKSQLAADLAPQTQTGSSPPGVTEALIDTLDDEFQVLFFKVAGLTLAVPLVSLGGIVKLERVNHIMGRPAWYHGVQTHRDSQLNIVDTCAWVMPEKYDDKLAQSVDYQYIVLLEESNWGLACESLVNSVKILKSEVNWRTKAGKRPWLAGVVKQQMCGILHVQALIELLNLGLGSQDSID